MEPNKKYYHQGLYLEEGMILFETIMPTQGNGIVIFNDPTTAIIFWEDGSTTGLLHLDTKWVLFKYIRQASEQEIFAAKLKYSDMLSNY
jgi:hypothetical protein